MSFQQKRTSSENEDNQLNFQLQNQQLEEENTPHIFTSNLSQPEELNSDQFEMNQETVEQIKQSDQKEQNENLDQDNQTNEVENENENINIKQFNQQENLEKDDNQDYQKYNQEQEKQQQDSQSDLQKQLKYKQQQLYNLEKNVKKLNINLEDQANQVELPPVFDPFGPLEESDIIKIEVVKPVNQQSTIKKFVTYQIKYSYLDQEPITVCRRYSEFSVLRKTLQTIFPGYFIPQIPEKQHLNYSEYKMIKFRHKVFNGFLKKIVIFKCFLESQALKIFLDPDQEDCKKTLLNLECPSMAETIQISGKYFSELSGIDVGEEQINKDFQQFQKNIDNSIQMLKNLIIKFTNLADTKDIHTKNMTSLLEFCLPDYERENISEYIDKDQSRLIITNQNLTQFQKLKEKLMQNQNLNPYRQILECLQNEFYDMEGLKESFGQKQQFDQQIEELDKQEQKLNQEIQKYKKQSGKGLFSSKTPEEKIQEKQQQLELVEEEKENLIKYQNILMAIFIFVYKKQFIKHKIVTYKKLFNLIGKTEINKSEIQKLFWSQFGNYAQEIKQHDHQLKI